MTHLTFTFDLEDPRPSTDLPLRVVEPTEVVLNLLASNQVRGTFFSVATTSDQNPDLIRAIQRAGHEVALHSLDHQPLVALSEDQFRQSTREGKEILEDILGQPVYGYRAPNFSLTPETPWVPDVLAELGFSYSSSILPVKHPFHGYPGAPRTPFRWPSGLVEIPAPITRVGLWQLPYLGGIYFRYLPLGWVRRRMHGAEHLWFYAHPYDFDPQQPYYQMAGVSTWASLLLWFNRTGSEKKLAALLGDTSLQFQPPFAEQVFEDLPGYR